MASVYYYLLTYPPAAAFLILFAVGLLTRDDTGRSSFMEHGLTISAFGLCFTLLGSGNVLFADRAVRDHNAGNLWRASWCPILRVFCNNKPMSTQIWEARIAGTLAGLMGVVISVLGFFRWLNWM
jgi:hypothetical protein